MNLPEQLLSRLEKAFPEKYESILQGFSTQRLGSFRINTLKSSPEEVLAELQEKNIEITPFEHIENFFFFDKKYEYALKGSDCFYNGKIYLQSLSSMIPVLVLEPKKSRKILDICAAPGSKTTQIAEFTKNSSTITALEKNQIRYEKLKYNCKLQGAISVKIKKTDAKKYLRNEHTPMFDQMLLDAPCSSEGRISLKNEKSYCFWNEEIIEKNAKNQEKLLHLALKKLKPGGTLVYSTCTLAPEENEQIILKILEKNSDISVEKVDLWESEYFSEGISGFTGKKFKNSEKFLRIFPSSHSEGFFIAKLKKD